VDITASCCSGGNGKETPRLILILIYYWIR
jgi:hypothetical protein